MGVRCEVGRSIGPMVEASLLECRSPELAQKIAEGPLTMPKELIEADRRDLDDAVFELLGINDPKRRVEFVNRLYVETALHFRQIRVVEIQKMEQRRESVPRGFSAEELAVDLWDAGQLPESIPLREWLAQQLKTTTATVIPDASPAFLSDHAKMFDNNTVYFGKGRKEYVICKSRGEAELVKLLADLGVHGTVNVPRNADGCEELRRNIEERIALAKACFEELARTRTGLEEKQTEVVDLLVRWFVLGRPITNPTAIQ